jgi:methylmalonyl-CoA/ethylmalonyl-CoA epimerase
MPTIKKIHHVAIVVEDLDRSLSFWRDSLGMELTLVKDVPEQNAQIAFLPAGESEIELVRPIGLDSGLARYLKNRGPGLHHVCVQVEGIEILLNELKNKGVRLINEKAIPGDEGRLFAFIHPESTGGVLVELYELPGEE